MGAVEAYILWLGLGIISVSFGLPGAADVNESDEAQLVQQLRAQSADHFWDWYQVDYPELAQRVKRNVRDHILQGQTPSSLRLAQMIQEEMERSIHAAQLLLDEILEEEYHYVSYAIPNVFFLFREDQRGHWEYLTPRLEWRRVSNNPQAQAALNRYLSYFSAETDED